MIINFSRCFPSLQRFVVFGAIKLTDAAVEAIVKHCPALETLPLGGWDLLTDKALVALGQLTRFKNLHLTGNQDYTKSSIISIVRNNPGIQMLSLTLRDNARCDSTVFRHLAGYCNNLKDLNIDVSSADEDLALPPATSNSTPASQLEDEDLIPLIGSSPLLESLFVDGMSRLTEKLLFELSTKCHMLSILELRGHSRFGHPSDSPLITDESIAALTRGCPKLGTLTLGPCMEITDQGILSIAKHCKRLTHLSLENNDKITDAGMRVLLESCTQLTTFAAIQISNLTDESMLALPAHCPQLSSLALSGIAVTEAFLRSLAKYCPRLANLNLRSFTFTNKAYYTLRPLLLQCPALTDMQFNMCPGFTNHSLINLLTRHSKQLKYLTILDCLDLVNDKTQCECIKAVPSNLRLTVKITKSTMMALMTAPQYHYYYELEEDEVEVEEGVLGEEEVVD